MLARMPFLFVLLFVPGSGNCPGRDGCEVDVLEVNMVHDGEMRPAYVQVIAWRRFVEDGDRLHNVGWRMVSSLADLPVQHGERWHVVSYESRQAISVSAPLLRRSWTQCDPERVDSRDWWRGNAPNIFQQIRGHSYDRTEHGRDASDE